MGFDLVQELNQKINELNVSVKQLRVSGSARAETERDYKIKLSQKVAELRAEGQPVTLVSLLVYGDKEVAELRFKRDMADVVYQANQEAINSAKLQMRLLESQIQREWGKVINV